MNSPVRDTNTTPSATTNGKGFPHSNSLPTRNLNRSNGRRSVLTATLSTLTKSAPVGSTTTSTATKPTRWRQLFRRRQHVQINDAHDAASIQETDDASSVAQSLEEALAELDLLDDIQNDSDDELAGLQNDDATHAASSLRNLITVTLEPTSAHRQIMLLSATDTLQSKIHKDYTAILLLDQSQQQEYCLEASLAAAKHVVQEFLSVQDLIQHATMPDTLQELVFVTIQDYIYPRIAHLYSALDTVTPADAAKIVSFIHHFLATIEDQCPSLQPYEAWTTDCEILVQHYLATGVRQEMQELVQRSLDFQNSEDDVRKLANGTLVTGYPNQISFLCEIQLQVAQELLPAIYTERVLAVCNEELLTMVCDLMLQVETHWKEFSSSRFCAIINDTSILSEQCDDRNRLYLSTPDYMEAGAEMSCELAQVSLHATRYLAERIMLDLHKPEPILTRVGDEHWESDEFGSTVERTVATLKDFFGDVENWVISGDYFFPKVLKHCLDLTLQVYVQSFFSNTMSQGVRNAEAAANELNQDYLRLVIFFNGENFTKYIGTAGFYSQHEINSRLHILQSLSMLINPTLSPNELYEEVKVVLMQLRSGENGVPAVLHLAGLRKRGAAKDAIDWLKVIAEASKLIEKDAASVVSSPCYKVPDLRNSKWIRNIRPTRRQLNREISDNSRSQAETTFRLVRSRAPTSVALAVTANRRALTSSLTGR